MSLRFTTHRMTGRPSRGAEVACGYNAYGKPHVTVHPYDREHSCYDDPAVLRGLVEDLNAAIAHLEGPS